MTKLFGEPLQSVQEALSASSFKVATVRVTRDDQPLLRAKLNTTALELEGDPVHRVTAMVAADAGGGAVLSVLTNMLLSDADAPRCRHWMEKRLSSWADVLLTGVYPPLSVGGTFGGVTVQMTGMLPLVAVTYEMATNETQSETR